ncbi:hypothetical protein B0682_01175 [Moraxella lincolnii]|uniref:Uncharacterized protein n=1 Tax=Lwoffella lincolnii TaxID=90241 RepID=A0A1T0CKI7_9GAMM|nr:hypothetical protein B0682_01175 [Moraxella lincolnii]
MNKINKRDMNKKTHDGNCQFAILANFLSVRIYVEKFYVERFYDCMMKSKISTQKYQHKNVSKCLQHNPLLSAGQIGTIC